MRHPKVAAEFAQSQVQFRARRCNPSACAGGRLSGQLTKPVQYTGLCGPKNRLRCVAVRGELYVMNRCPKINPPPVPETEVVSGDLKAFSQPR